VKRYPVEWSQLLPTGLLEPILDVLQQLVERYGCTVVLSTATQPAFNELGLPGDDIVPPEAAKEHFHKLERVRYEQPPIPLEWYEVATAVAREKSALAIVNTRRDALALYDSLADSEALHLSTSLCAVHRLDVLREVRRRLKAKEPCKLISTQVVEAGVDIDFPVVLRAMAPLESIV
jgi:CRISPR-associated endonuclease/helicase Cas3